MITTVGFPPSGLIHRITNSLFPVKLEIRNQTDYINLNSELCTLNSKKLRGSLLIPQDIHAVFSVIGIVQGLGIPGPAGGTGRRRVRAPHDAGNQDIALDHHV